MTAPAAVLPPPAVRSARWTPARIAGWVLCGLWGLLGVYLLWSMTIAFPVETFQRYIPRMLQGLVVTAKLVVGSVVIGGILAIPLALARLSRLSVVRGAAFLYVYFFRGTPLLAQMFLLYYGAGQLRPQLESLGLWWFLRDAFNCVLLAFTLNTAAYQAEIYKTAIQTIPPGQREAAMSLGLPPVVTFFKVVLPQAMITALRPLGNEIILMIKSSAVASIVTVFDLMGATKLAFSRTYNFDVYLWAAIIYLAIVEALRRTLDAVERYITRHLRRTP